MTNDETTLRNRDDREAFDARAAELRAELALVEHLRDGADEEQARELRSAFGHAAQARAEIERRVNEAAVEEASRGLPDTSFRWGHDLLPAMLWRCGCGGNNKTVNPQLKAAWQQGARPKVLARCSQCGTVAKLIESSILLAADM